MMHRSVEYLSGGALGQYCKIFKALQCPMCIRNGLLPIKLAFQQYKWLIVEGGSTDLAVKLLSILHPHIQYIHITNIDNAHFISFYVAVGLQWKTNMSERGC